MASAAFVITITDPSGAVVDVPVKQSTLIRYEEQLGAPLAQRIRQGFTGAAERLGFMVGQQSGAIPPEMSFDEFIDSDESWSFEFRNPEPPVVDAEGNL
jgi:hypothetical protein